MNKKEKALKRLKAQLEKEQGREITDAEMDQVEHFLRMLARMQVDWFLEDQRRQLKLKEFPGGFHFEESGYSCSICGRLASGKNSWFDRHGLKCGACQRGFNSKEIRAWLGKRKDAWCSAVELEIFFSLKESILRQWIQKGLLAARTVSGGRKGFHLLVFLIRENKALLPPKRLLKGGMVKEMVDGREEIVFAP